jgi:hypothetical protein
MAAAGGVGVAPPPPAEDGKEWGDGDDGETDDASSDAGGEAIDLADDALAEEAGANVDVASDGESDEDTLQVGTRAPQRLDEDDVQGLQPASAHVAHELTDTTAGAARGPTLAQLMKLWFQWSRESYVRDVLNEFGNAGRFLIDVDALLLHVLRNLPGRTSGAMSGSAPPSTLAVTFLLERFLQDVRVRFGQFDLVVFDEHDRLFWALGADAATALPWVRLTRRAIVAHLSEQLAVLRYSAAATMTKPSTETIASATRLWVVDDLWASGAPIQRWETFLRAQAATFFLSDLWPSQADTSMYGSLRTLLLMGTVMAGTGVVRFSRLELSPASFRAFVCNWRQPPQATVAELLADAATLGSQAIGSRTVPTNKVLAPLAATPTVGEGPWSWEALVAATLLDTSSDTTRLDLVYAWLVTRALQLTLPLAARQVSVDLEQPSDIWTNVRASVPALEQAHEFITTLVPRGILCAWDATCTPAGLEAADVLDPRLFHAVLVLAHACTDTNNGAVSGRPLLMLPPAARTALAMLVRSTVAELMSASSLRGSTSEHADTRAVATVLDETADCLAATGDNTAALPWPTMTPDGSSPLEEAVCMSLLEAWGSTAEAEKADLLTDRDAIVPIENSDVAAIAGTTVSTPAPAPVATRSLDSATATEAAAGLLRRDHHWYSPRLLESDSYAIDEEGPLSRRPPPSWKGQRRRQLPQLRLDDASVPYINQKVRGQQLGALAQSRRQNSLLEGSAWPERVTIPLAPEALDTASREATATPASSHSHGRSSGPVAGASHSQAIKEKNLLDMRAAEAIALSKAIDNVQPEVQAYLQGLRSLSEAGLDLDRLERTLSSSAKGHHVAVAAKCSVLLLECWLRVANDAARRSRPSLDGGLPAELRRALAHCLLTVRVILSLCQSLVPPPPRTNAGTAPAKGKSKVKPGTHISAEKAQAAAAMAAAAGNGDGDWPDDEDIQKLLVLIRKLGWPDLLRAAARTLHSEAGKVAHAPWTAFVGAATAVQFQIEHAAEHLVRAVGTAVDSRVMFQPDTWQVQLLDAVDAKRSVIVVAPTSAGKTFISFYAMERVLRDSNDGILVYVAPTKELVLQTHAEILARFSKPLSFAGMFTRDFRSNLDTCQILVTVPQCLNVLLLSTGHATRRWRERLKYVVFDEVHNVVLDGGEVWEQLLLMVNCPFLALSATIGDADRFNEWLRRVDRRRIEDHRRPPNSPTDSPLGLVEVTWNQRYNDLALHVYAPAPGDSHETLLRVDPLWSWVTEPGAPGSMAIPDDLRLLPEDVVRARRALADVIPGLAPSPDEFFSSQEDASWRLSMADARAYERHLKNELGLASAAASSHPALDAALVALVAPTGTAVRQGEPTDGQTTEKFIAAHVVGLLDSLKERDKLPGILFYMNKRGCEEVANTIVEELEKRRSAALEGPGGKTLRKLNAELVLRETTLKDLRARIGSSPTQAQEAKLLAASEDWSATKTKCALETDAIWRANSYLPTKVDRVTPEEIDEIYNPRQLSWKPGFDDKNVLDKALLYGVGVHHAGLSKHYRNAVMTLFRQRKLGVIVATGTLAQGIHMPCRTVVFLGPSPFLTAIGFRQMSGRAGRRGFDLRGDVVFFGFREEEIRRVLRAELPLVRPNRPVRPSLALRIVMQLNLIRREDRLARDSGQQKEPSNSADMCVAAARRLLQNGIDCLPAPEFAREVAPTPATVASYNAQTFRFCLDVVHHEGLVDSLGRPTQLSALVSHLHFLEPANLAIVHLLRSGLLGSLTAAIPSSERRLQDVKKEKYLRLLAVFCHVLEPIPVSARAKYAWGAFQPSRRPFASLYLPALPAEIARGLAEFNTRQLRRAVAYYGSLYDGRETGLSHDVVLPFSRSAFTPRLATAVAHNQWLWCRPPRPLGRRLVVRSAFVGLLGLGDGDFASAAELAATRRTDAWIDESSIPQARTQQRASSYVYQFVRGQSDVVVERCFALNSSEVYESAKNISLALRAIAEALRRIALDNAELVAAGNLVPTLTVSDELVDLVDNLAMASLMRLNT